MNLDAQEDEREELCTINILVERASKRSGNGLIIEKMDLKRQ